MLLHCHHDGECHGGLGSDFSVTLINWTRTSRCLAWASETPSYQPHHHCCFIPLDLIHLLTTLLLAMDALVERYSRPQLASAYDSEDQDDFAQNPITQPINFSMPPISQVGVFGPSIKLF